MKTRKNKQKRKIKTRRLLRGGKPDFIKIVAYHKDGLLVDYKIMYDSFNIEDQNKYAKIHKVYYSIGSKSLFNDVMDLFKIEPKIVNIKIKSFFSLPDKNSNYKLVDYQTIAIHHPDDIKKIEITNQIIQNINGDTTIQNSLQKYDGNNSKLIEEYKKFIKTNEKTFLKNIDEPSGRKLLNTPVFLNIIGIRYGFIDTELENLDKIKELMDAPITTTSSTATSSTATSSTATSSTATSSTGPTSSTATSSTGPTSSTATSSLPTGSISSLPTATSSTAPISTRRKIDNRLRDLINKLSIKP